MSAAARARVAVVLAAGKGTRMRSELPKVLHPVGGRPLLAWVLDAARRGGAERILVVVGHGADEVRARFADDDVVWVEQTEQLGTGHALAQAEPHVDGDALLLVLSGDVPLLRPATLDRLADAAQNGWGAMATAEHDDPGALGRVMARDGGRLERIVEARDAGPEELACTLINAGIYALPAPEIFAYLRRLEPRNAQGELYLTDALGAAADDGKAVSLVALDDPAEAFGVNDRADQARVHRTLIDRHLRVLMAAGVSILEPARTIIEPSVQVASDATIHPAVALHGATTIGARCVIHQGAWIRDSELAEDVVIKPYTVVDRAVVQAGANVGPFSRLRPESVLEPETQVGNFVELKKTRLGRGAKASHLTYLGDATVGARANVGAGVVTCNYDGKAKHPTEIGEDAFIGSDTMLVAPVRVGDRATTGAGSTITNDVPDDALAVARARQRNVPDWRRRSGN